MFKIRRVYDDAVLEDKEAIGRAQSILKDQFPGIHPKEIKELPLRLRNPLKYRFRSILFIAEGGRGQIKGFALMYHDADLQYCYVDLLSADKEITGRGVGGALFARTREEALALKTIGIFGECYPDDPKLVSNPQKMKQNKRRLRFYEWFSNYPIINTNYEKVHFPTNTSPLYLMFDNLGQNIKLSLDTTKMIVRTILERKYGQLCSNECIDDIVNSFHDDPVLLRKPKYITQVPHNMVSLTIPDDKRISLVVANKYRIHHLQEKGYLEAPVNVDSILSELEKVDIFQRQSTRVFNQKMILAVHNSGMVNYLKTVCASLKPDRPFYPSVFPLRNRSIPPSTIGVRAGYYCTDAITPIENSVYLAAKDAVDCSLTAAKTLVDGQRVSYALVSPPGHHAESGLFGGFCYLNSTAIAAQYLSEYGKVAVLDIDYHHGKGVQEIFYKRSDVLTISIHCHPRTSYPYISGFAYQNGEASGKGFNINIPLPEQINSEQYSQVLKKSLARILRFKPRFLVVALGFDTASGDPTGTWNLESKDFEENGKSIGLLHLPTLIVQEGGYNSQQIGVHAKHFFMGLWESTFQG